MNLVDYQSSNLVDYQSSNLVDYSKLELGGLLKARTCS